METIVLLAIAVVSLFLGILSLFYIRKLRATALKHSQENEKRERELKRQVLELQVLRSLSERVGYSLDLRQILEVIVGSLGGIVEFSTISYLLADNEGRVTLKTHIAESVSRQFLSFSKTQIINAFSVMAGKPIAHALVEEIISGKATDDLSNLGVESFFNLPVVVGGQVVALINVSSSKKGLYGDEETAILYIILKQVSSSISKLWQVVENEKRKLSAMIFSLDDGVLMVDPQFNLLVTNPALSRLLSLSEEVTLFRVITALAEKHDLKAAVQQVIAGQQRVQLAEFEIDANAVQIDIEPVKDQSGCLLGAVVIFHDVTGQRHLERMREEFTAMMVHELRTPLTTIIYSTDMMTTDMPKLTPADITQNLNIIRATTTEMLSLVSDLLDVAKIEAGKFVVAKKEEDLGQLLEEKFAVFKPLIDQKRLRLVAEVSPGLSNFSFDRRRISQALDNLIANAIKYTDSGQITVRVEEKGSQVVISVADTGEGIRPEDKAKLFSKFEQLGKGKTGEKGGTGLGLVITKGIIEAHGGKIWVESFGSGHGSTFSFSLPLG